MQKTVISFFFVTLTASAFFITSTCFAQSLSGTINGDSIIVGKHGIVIGRINPNSIIRRWMRVPSNADSMPRYCPDPDKHYYMDIAPPTQKGKRVDHSKIWLLKEEVAASCH